MLQRLSLEAAAFDIIINITDGHRKYAFMLNSAESVEDAYLRLCFMTPTRRMGLEIAIILETIPTIIPSS